MKYLCLVYSEEKKLETFPDDESVAYDESGHCIASEALQPVQTATTVRVRNGKAANCSLVPAKGPSVMFYLIEARDLNEAIQTTSKIPPARAGSVEVRPIRELAGRTVG